MSEQLMCVVNKIHCTHNREGECNLEEHCHVCIPQCFGCNRALALNGTHYCAAYPLPKAQWRRGVCALASHTFVSDVITVKINPLKLARQRRLTGG
jgi:hypothetical protein